MKLFLDTTTSFFNIGLIDKSNNLVDFISHNNERSHTENCNEQLKNFLEKNNITYKNISDILLIIGPGTFTGTRVALTIAKTIAYIYKNINLFTITSLDFQLESLEGMSVVKAYGDNFYVVGYKGGKKILVEQILDETTYIEMAKDLNLDIIKTNKQISVKKLLLKNMKKFKKIDNARELKPVYIKGVI